MSIRKTYYNIKNFVPSKKMGQNFLIDDTISRKIVHDANIQNHDVIVEIGPGGGALTQYLLEFNKPLILIELDKRLVEQLQRRFGQHQNLHIINRDVLHVDIDKLAGDYQRPVLISNLPYSITTPMLLKFLHLKKVNTFYCMLQKELVQRLLAMPGTKEYGSISVLMQTYTNISNIVNVPPKCFSPMPKVESSVVLMQKKKIDFDSKWAMFVRRCFSFKRKTLFNNLKTNFTKHQIQQCYKALRINDNTRAEELNVGELYDIYRTLCNENN